jgi:hypothetical protein
VHEQAVGIAIQHLEARAFEPAFRPQQQLFAHTRDRVCERRIEKPAGRRTEHAVKRVHQYLDGLRCDIVMVLLCRLAARKELIEHPRQDCVLAAKRSARSLNQLAGGGGVGVGHVR